MNEAFKHYLLWAAFLSYLMALVVRVRSRSKTGPTPFLAVGFAAFGTLALVLRAEGPTWITVLLGAILAVALFFDFGVRSARRPDTKEP
ncbi:MAG: hypothetical protein HONBIEJF_00054 [Fimbriimonadaceae bacterium]|nr:hypothetical protein [Fimbriimonadaceae bacterium]